MYNNHVHDYLIQLSMNWKIIIGSTYIIRVEDVKTIRNKYIKYIKSKSK